MADPFIAEMGALMEGQGYQTILCTEPNYRDYSPDLPTVYISPIDRPEIKFLGFGPSLTAIGHRNVKMTYELVYLYLNSLDPAIVDNDTWDFKTTIINLFMGVPLGLYDLGVWQSRVTDGLDYDRYLFKKGYTYAVSRVNLDYVENNP